MRTAFGLAVLLTAACLVSCAEEGAAQSARRNRKQESSEMKQDKGGKKSWAESPCTGIKRLAEYDGLTERDLEAKLGAPRAKESYLREERQDEFHVVLENVYPLKKAENRKVPLQEWTWREKDCQLTVWLHQEGGVWKSFLNSRYSATADF